MSGNWEWKHLGTRVTSMCLRGNKQVIIAHPLSRFHFFTPNMSKYAHFTKTLRKLKNNNKYLLRLRRPIFYISCVESGRPFLEKPSSLPNQFGFRNLSHPPTAGVLFERPQTYLIISDCLGVYISINCFPFERAYLRTMGYVR